MNGLELLEWLQAIPRQELREARVLLELGRLDENTLVTAKYYRDPHYDGEQSTIILIHK